MHTTDTYFTHFEKNAIPETEILTLRSPQRLKLQHHIPSSCRKEINDSTENMQTMYPTAKHTQKIGASTYRSRQAVKRCWKNRSSGLLLLRSLVAVYYFTIGDLPTCFLSGGSFLRYVPKVHPLDLNHVEWGCSGDCLQHLI
ncbi:hypothetical protein KC19_9G163000 [Ceratodon purpureus]|uniref:Uncharacterized protein n=1 Tax=Ceratodon purpureus TaxID=3225 RepID=A0A8T0GSK8_CERPU|nr:hypothetical protein KC19_9G162800 [Ceratodon purpureus]KAG0562661.1 hypothetical protein KC19_9G163000 [Ceratodon purpureus]